jgi:hypothetical protein
MEPKKDFISTHIQMNAIQFDLLDVNKYECVAFSMLKCVDVGKQRQKISMISFEKIKKKLVEKIN